MLKNSKLGEKYLLTAINKDYASPCDKSLVQSTKPILTQALEFFKPPVQKQVDGEDGEAQEEEVKAELAPIGFMPDLRSDARAYEWAGFSFGEYDTMLLQKNLQKLATSSGASQLRLWGKIIGTERDYYVAEGVVEGGGEEEGAEPVEGMEPRGTGVNKYAYWACNGPLGAWTMLPDLQPKDLINAKAIKVSFTGDLSRKIYTNPFYFETEKTYLRAQIARISFSTTLAPKKLYRLQEENDREIEDNVGEEEEALQPPTTQDMGWIDSWVHHTPSILKQGRLVHKEGQPLEGEEDVEPEELLAREIKKDPWEPRLKPISKDAHTRGGTPAWVVRSYNVRDTYVNPTNGKATENYGIVVVKSLWWPGATAFFQGGRTFHVYVGNGQKHESDTYFPVKPPVMI